MFNFILPTQKGLELFPPRLGVPPQVRVRGVDLRTKVGQAAFRKALPDAQSFYNQQAHNFSLSIIDNHIGRHITERGDTLQVSFSHGQEYIDIGISPRTVAEAGAEELPARVLTAFILDPQTVRDEDPDRPYILVDPGNQEDSVRQFDASPDMDLYSVTRGTSLDTDQDKVFGTEGGWRARGVYERPEARLTWGDGGVYRGGRELVTIRQVTGACVVGAHLVIADDTGIYTVVDPGEARNLLFPSDLEAIFDITDSIPNGSIEFVWVSPGGTKMIVWAEDELAYVQLIDISLATGGGGVTATEDRRRDIGDRTPSSFLEDVDLPPAVWEGTHALTPGWTGPWDGWLTFEYETTSSSDTFIAGLVWDSWNPSEGVEETYSDVVNTRTTEFRFKQTQSAVVDTSYSGTSTQEGTVYARSLVVASVPGYGDIVLEDDLRDDTWTLTNTWTTVEVTANNYEITGHLELTLDTTHRDNEIFTPVFTGVNGPCDFFQGVEDETTLSNTFVGDTYNITGTDAYDAVNLGFSLNYLRDPDDENSIWYFVPDTGDTESTFGYPAIAIFGPLPAAPNTAPGDISAERANMWADMTSVPVADSPARSDTGLRTYDIYSDGELIFQQISDYAAVTPLSARSVFYPLLADHIAGRRFILDDKFGLGTAIGNNTDDPPEDYPDRNYNTGYAPSSQGLTWVELLDYSSGYVRLSEGSGGSFKDHGFANRLWPFTMNSIWAEDRGVLCITSQSYIRDEFNQVMYFNYISGSGDTNVLHDYVSVPEDDVADPNGQYGVHII